MRYVHSNESPRGKQHIVRYGYASYCGRWFAPKASTYSDKPVEGKEACANCERAAGLLQKVGKAVTLTKRSLPETTKENLLLAQQLAKTMNIVKVNHSYH